MALANFYNVPKNDAEFDIFSFTNQTEHQKIAYVLKNKYNLQQAIYPLDPMPLDDMGAWLTMHQTLHAQAASVTGTISDDLSTVNLKDSSQLSSWIQIHAQAHYDLAKALRLK